MRAPRQCLLWVAVSLLLAGGLPAASSPRQESPPTGLILGVVSDDAGRPIGGIRVTRWLVGANDLRQYEAITDGQGRFVFVNVAPGNWRIVAEGAGYITGAYGRRRPAGPDRLISVTTGGVTPPIAITIFRRDGVISGTVTDDRGEPAVGVTVRALTRHARARDILALPATAAAVTDDRGSYRLAVPAGEYGVLVTGPLAVTVPAGAADRRFVPPGWTSAIGDRMAFARDDVHVYPDAAPGRSLPPPMGPLGPTGVYVTAMHPAAGAPLIAVAAGGERSGVDLQLRLAPVTQVRGRVIGPAGPVPAGTPVLLYASAALPLSIARGVMARLDLQIGASR